MSQNSNPTTGNPGAGRDKAEIARKFILAIKDFPVFEIQAIGELLYCISDREEPDWELFPESLRPAFKAIWEEIRPLLTFEDDPVEYYKGKPINEMEPDELRLALSETMRQYKQALEYLPAANRQ